jgi:hypothetical protein
MLYGKITAGSLYVRNGPGSSYGVIGTLKLDDYVIASENIGGWWHLVDAKRGGYTGLPVSLLSGQLLSQRASLSNDVWCSVLYTLPIDPPAQQNPSHNVKVVVDGNIIADIELK